MQITNELLAAYAENNVSKEERIKIREYLVEHTEELETLMIMMDDDYDISLNKNDVNQEQSNCKGLVLEDSSAAFAPMKSSYCPTNNITTNTKQGFDVVLNKLLEEI